MTYKGDIIEESLADPTTLKTVHIINTRVEPITPEHETPWLKQWTLHTIEVPEADAGPLAERLSRAIEHSHGGHWYIDFKNDEIHYIIFPDKVFKVDRSKPDEYKPVVVYGLSLSIPRHQLDFSPEIKYWERPESAADNSSDMRTIHRTIVSALVFSKDGKLLMGMKDPKDGGVYADCWHIPGGGVDEGETQEQALRREMLEEVGIDIENCRVTLADDKGSGETEKTLKDTGEKVLCKMQFNVYRVDVDQNADDIATKLSDDLVKLEWVDPSKLSEYKLTPPSVTLFERLGYLI